MDEAIAPPTATTARRVRTTALLYVAARLAIADTLTDQFAER
jgi:hypothetical protein